MDKNEEKIHTVMETERDIRDDDVAITIAGDRELKVNVDSNTALGQEDMTLTYTDDIYTQIQEQTQKKTDTGTFDADTATGVETDITEQPELGT